VYIVGLVLGIIGLLGGLIPLIGWLAIPFNLVAIIIGIVGIKKKVSLEKSEYQMAIASLVLGAIPVGLKLFTIIGLVQLASS